MSDDIAFIEKRNELVLRAWEMGMDTTRIARGLEMSRSAVLGVVHRARVAGDDRAVSRAGEHRERSLRGAGRNANAPNVTPERQLEAQRRYQAKKRAEKFAAYAAYADGSAWDRASA